VICPILAATWTEPSAMECMRDRCAWWDAGKRKCSIAAEQKSSEGGGNVYVIWSYEHQAWWRPDMKGYTLDLNNAGRYTMAEACEILNGANGGERPNECAIPVAQLIRDIDPSEVEETEFGGTGPAKVYLGDSVYAAWDGEYVILTTENGMPSDPSNRIYLDGEVRSALLRYFERCEGA